MNEAAITKATFRLIANDLRVKRACGLSVPDPSKMMTDYRGCVTNMVNLMYREVAVDNEIQEENPLNTRKVTSNVRSYLKSALAVKYQCAPKGRAQMMQFANQDRCLRDIVGMSQAKWFVRVKAQRGDWYNALMGMSGVFKQWNMVRSDCRLVRKGYRHRVLYGQYTCEQAALYMQYNALEMAMSAKKENGEKFFYFAAQTYAGAMGMGAQCHSGKQAWYALTRGEVTMAKKMIQRRGGNFQQCMAASQTGFSNYKGFLMNYMQMNVQGMSKYMKRIYNYESNTMKTCFNKPYPRTSNYQDWNKCVGSAADYLAADRNFGNEYMTMRRSNWTRLGNDLGRMMMDTYSMKVGCNQNKRYRPSF